MVLVLAIAGNGCATALNMQDAKMHKPYGGVTMSLNDFCGGEPGGDYAAFVCWPIWLADKPLSLCADTITLPYLLWLQRDAQQPQNGQSAEPVQSP
jgi:hypothetical protein